MILLLSVVVFFAEIDQRLTGVVPGLATVLADNEPIRLASTEPKLWIRWIEADAHQTGIRNC